MSCTVLVIEDNPINQELVCDLLLAHGFVVHTARNAEDGLRIAFTTSIHLVLMDLSLPGLDGLEATRALKCRQATAHLPVIALTAHAMRGDEAIARNAGCDGYITKPIDTRTLVSQISKFVAAASTQAPPETVR